jgi:tRNA(Ile2) C34 agmatinyltransferase TiaS
MPQMQPYPPVCPKCKKFMKLMLTKASGGDRKFQCADCGQPDPMHDAATSRWLTGELRERK